MTIKITSPLEKANPNDTYKLINKDDVSGVEVIEDHLSTIDSEIVTINNTLVTKISGVSIEDPLNNEVTNIDRLILDGAIVSDNGNKTATITVPIKGYSIRVGFLTLDTNILKQTLLLDNTPQVITYNQQGIFSDPISLDLPTGVFTFNKSCDVIFSLSAQIIREVGGSGLVDWTVFAETSVDNGLTWQPVIGSARRVSFASQESNENKFVDLSSTIRVQEGVKFRFMHSTNNSTRQVSIISYPQVGSIPVNSGVIVSVYTTV